MLKKIIEQLQKDNAVFLPYAEEASKYVASGEAETSEVKFVRDTSKEVTASFVHDLVWSKSGINLSIRFQEFGTIELKDEDVVAGNLQKSLPVTRYKTWALVRNGVSTFTHWIVRDANGERKIEVAGLPLFSEEDYQAVVSGDVVLNQVSQSFLEARVKIIEALVKTSRDLLNKKKLLPGEIAYPQKQAEILEKYHVNSRGVFNPPYSYKSSSGESSGEKVMEFQIKGLSSLPSWNAFEKAVTEKKVTTTPLKFMAKQYEVLQQELGDLFDLCSIEIFEKLHNSEKTLKAQVEEAKKNATLYRAAVVNGKLAVKDSGEIGSAGEYTLIVKK